MMDAYGLQKKYAMASGMTLRDYFAAKAMQAFINRAPDGAGFGSSFKDRNLNYSNAAYAMADAMLKAREQN